MKPIHHHRVLPAAMPVARPARAWPVWAAAAGRRLWRHQGGAVNMEYVVMALLVAVGAVLVVITFGRSIASMFIAGSESAALEAHESQTNLDVRRADRAVDGARSRMYHDATHE